MANPASLTGEYLSGEEIPCRDAARGGSMRRLTIVGARDNNLRDLTARFRSARSPASPAFRAGKSTLVLDTLYKALSQKLNRSREAPGAHDASRASSISTR